MSASTSPRDLLDALERLVASGLILASQAAQIYRTVREQQRRTTRTEEQP